MKITTSTQDLFVGFLVDESASMQIRRQDVIDGFNQWKKEQLEQEGNTFVSLSKFNTNYTQVSSGKELSEVAALDYTTYAPSGGTALFDAIDRAISDMDKWLIDNPGFTGKSLLIIQTDGEENASGEVTKLENVKSRITDKREAGWAIAFMGADIDAFSGGGQVGIASGSTLAYAGASTSAAFNTLSTATSHYRSAPRTVASASTFFSSIDTSEVTPPVQQVAADLGVTAAVADDAYPDNLLNEAEAWPVFDTSEVITMTGGVGHPSHIVFPWTTIPNAGQVGFFAQVPETLDDLWLTPQEAQDAVDDLADEEEVDDDF